MKGLRWRSITVIASILFSIYLLIPSYLRFSSGTAVPRITKPGDPWYYHVLPSEVLKLGLDLRGGLHLVMGIDFEEIRKDAVQKLKRDCVEMAEREKANVTFEVQGNEVIGKFSDEADWKKVFTALTRNQSEEIDFIGQTKDSVRLKMSTMYESAVRSGAIEQSLETLRNRIDEFGIAEPIIQRQGDDKILIQFPGVLEVGRIKDIIGRTAKLSFQVEVAGPDIPEGNPSLVQLQTWVDEYNKAKNTKIDPLQPISNYLKGLNEWAASKLPPETEILFKRETNINTKENFYIPYLLKKEALITGADLQDAFMSYHPEKGDPIVSFRTSPTGAIKFEKATRENIGKPMAIVLDSNVHSAPNIRSVISSNGMIEMGGRGKDPQELLNEVKDTALVLKSGALPARLMFLEERIIGPSLGQDAIEAGTKSLIIGLILVFFFMGFYYKGSGLVASGALFLNGIFVLALMAAFEGTLTLPGLAGLTLTLGMAVDANVLIFEHIREELKMGKSVASSIAEGYHRAFSAIFDGHVTTIVAGIVLLSFGYGPIRGFAVTMLMGLVASLYTSVFCTRVWFDYFVVSKNKSRITI